MELLVNEFGMTEFTSSYGLTEASPTCFNAFVDDTMDRRLTSVGTLMPHASAKVVNADGEILPIGSRGELCIAGYQLQQGYWRNEEKTAETMKRDADGVLWLHTGDEAFIDAYGYRKITGRFKDIIIRGAENIPVVEVENILFKHPAVHQAAIVAYPDERLGERACAFVTLKDGASFDFDEMQRFLGERGLSVQYWPERLEIRDSLPRSAAGKLLASTLIAEERARAQEPPP